MNTKINKSVLYSGAAWSILFAGISFYWAMGGRIGVRSLGGQIYEMALNPDPSFLVIVWITGFIKLFGAVFLLMLMINWKNTKIEHTLYFVIKISGLLLFMYGLLNSITISLSMAGILGFHIEKFAAYWRLFFWEPFWMLGGICYFFSVKKRR